MTWRAVARGRASRGIQFPVSMGGKTVAVWMAHEACAFVLLETCVDEINGERLVFGANSIVRRRWSLVRPPSLLSFSRLTPICRAAPHARAPAAKGWARSSRRTQKLQQQQAASFSVAAAAHATNPSATSTPAPNPTALDPNSTSILHLLPFSLLPNPRPPLHQRSLPRQCKLTPPADRPRYHTRRLYSVFFRSLMTVLCPV
jgi:hypothetical protein